MPVAILGMHRSGTSMLARVLSICGLYLGEEADMVPATDDNRKGHWEHKQLVRISAQVLAHFGGTAEDPPLLPAGWQEDDGLEPLREQASQLITSLFGARRDWGWKDPRTALTLPFWRQVVPDLRCILCMRNPLDAAASLATRNHISTRKALAMWQYYNEAALRNTRPEERLVVAYEAFFQDYRQALAPTLDFLGLPPLVEGSPEDAAIREFIDMGLKHHNHSLDDVLASPAVFSVTKILYVGLMRHPELIDSVFRYPAAEEHTLRGWGAEEGEIIQAQNTYIAQRAKEIVELREWADKQREALDWHVGHKTVLEGELADVRAWAGEQSGVIDAQTATIARLHQELAELRAWAGEQKTVIDAQTAEITRLQNATQSQTESGVR